jgi:hypothetical protein
MEDVESWLAAELASADLDLNSLKLELGIRYMQYPSLLFWVLSQISNELSGAWDEYTTSEEYKALFEHEMSLAEATFRYETEIRVREDIDRKLRMYGQQPALAMSPQEYNSLVEYRVNQLWHGYPFRFPPEILWYYQWSNDGGQEEDAKLNIRRDMHFEMAFPIQRGEYDHTEGKRDLSRRRRAFLASPAFLQRFEEMRQFYSPEAIAEREERNRQIEERRREDKKRRLAALRDNIHAYF